MDRPLIGLLAMLALALLALVFYAPAKDASVFSKQDREAIVGESRTHDAPPVAPSAAPVADTASGTPTAPILEPAPVQP